MSERGPVAPMADMAGVGVAPMRLAELVDRSTLNDMAESIQRLFGMPVRIYAESGDLIAEAMSGAAKSFEGRTSDIVRLESLPIEYDCRTIGRVVLGPYADARATLPDGSDLAVLSRADDAQIRRIGEHIATVLDLILFSGHKALLTSQMHLASIRESYRELEQKNLHLEEAYERLKELDRLKSNFLATVSHELRTPLTSIMGYGEMLAEGIAGPLNTEQAEFVETIRNKGEQLLGLILSLLDLSRLEQGGAHIQFVRTSVAEVLRDAATTLAPTAMKKEVKLSFDAPDDLPAVLGDPIRLRQVFVNLTENAIKFTPAGGSVTLTARVARQEQDDAPGLVLLAPVRQVIEARVADTGVGIPVAERERVFDPFYQVDQSSTREQGGTGLGLAIVKRLLDAHHGTVRIEDAHPQGTIFVVTLPVARTSMPPKAGTSSGPPRPPAPS